jgi:hypothetical protein
MDPVSEMLTTMRLKKGEWVKKRPTEDATALALRPKAQALACPFGEVWRRG